MNLSLRAVPVPVSRRSTFADKSYRPPSYRGHLAMLAVIALAEFGLPAIADASGLPPAGTSIGTLATAQYLDASGDQQTTRSNLVETLITSVYAIEVDKGQTTQIRSGLAGDKVRFMHQVVNVGNDVDGFTVTLQTSDAQLESIELYPDSNGNGEPDPGSAPVVLKTGEPHTFNGQLAAGAHAYLVVEAKTAAGTNAGARPAFKLAFASSKESSKSILVEDENLITDKGSFDLWPLHPQVVVEPGNELDAQFRARNLSRTEDGYVVIRLPLSEVQPNFDYQKGSFTVLKQPLDEETGAMINGKPAGMKRDVVDKTITAWFYLLKAQTVDVDFKLKAQPEAKRGASNSLVASFARAKTNADGSLDISKGAAEPDGNYLHARPLQASIDHMSGAAITGTLTLSHALYGIDEEFRPELTNYGSHGEIFSVQVDAGTNFPPGTTFTVLADDGRSPLALVDGMASTDEIAAGEKLPFRVRVSLPASASARPLGKATAKLRVVSRSGQSYDTALTIDKIESAAVALSKDVALESASRAVTDFTFDVKDPGKAIAIKLYVNNLNPAARPDRYRLRAIATDAAVTAAFHQPTSGDCSAENAGAVIDQTQRIEQNQAELVCLVVTPLEKQPKATLQISATSAQTLAVHSLIGTFDNAARVIHLRSSQSGNVTPGGSVIYSHVLENAGWTPIPAGKLFVSANSSEKRWTTDVYLDIDQSGKPQQAQRLSEKSQLPRLERGKPLTLLVQITAAADAASRTHNVTTLDINDDNQQRLAQIIDTTIVSVGTVSVVKAQAVDPDCKSSPPATVDFGTKTVGAKPGACIWYRVTVTNPGDTAVDDLHINDPIPTYAKLESQPTFTESANAAELVVPRVSGNSVVATQSRLEAQQKSTLIYSVKIAE